MLAKHVLFYHIIFPRQPNFFLESAYKANRNLGNKSTNKYVVLIGILSETTPNPGSSNPKFCSQYLEKKIAVCSDLLKMDFILRIKIDKKMPIKLFAFI